MDAFCIRRNEIGRKNERMYVHGLYLFFYTYYKHDKGGDEY